MVEPEFSPGVLLRDFEELRSFSMREHQGELAEFFKRLNEVLPLALHRLHDEFPGRSMNGACEVATRIVGEEASRVGLESVALQGDVALGDRDWLEHMVALFRGETVWVAVDLSVAQLTGMSDYSFAIVISDPSYDAMGTALHDLLGWWLPSG